MVNNKYVPVELPKTETIFYFNETEWNEGLTPEEIAKRDEITAYNNQLLAGEKGYGPCQNSLCGCHCLKSECDCGNPEFSIHKESNWKIGNGTASGGIGLGGHSVSGDVDFTVCRGSWSNADLKIGTVSAGVDAVDGGLGLHVKAGANVMDFKTDGFEIKAGINLDTGAGISSDGLELKLAGFGFTIGRKIEVSTIAGGASVDCVIQ